MVRVLDWTPTGGSARQRRAGLAWIALLGLLAGSAATPSAAQERSYRIGVLAEGRAVQLTERVVIPHLARLGFEEGRNLAIEIHPPTPDRIESAVRNLVARSPDAIISIGNLALEAASRATTEIPIVGFGPDFVGAGHARSLAQPGGNVTGVAILAEELDGKRLELLHEAVPKARRLAVLAHRRSPYKDATERIRAIATRHGFEVLFFEAEEKAEYAPRFEAMRASGVEGLAIRADPQFAREGAVLAGLARDYRLPTICQWREMAEQGCLIGYGPSLPDLYLRLADIVGRVLRGSRPAETPIEQPTRFELVINAATARALSVELPQAVLARADEVID